MSIVLMLIDDDHEDVELFIEALSTIDYAIECYTANNGTEALKMLHDGRPRPALIFTDLNMPIMNGWQCLIHLKRESALKDIPVIIYSTSSHPQDVALAKKLKATAFVSKPGRFPEIKRILNDIIALVDQNNLHALGDITGVISDGFEG